MRGWVQEVSRTPHRRSPRYVQAPFGGAAITLRTVARNCLGQPIGTEFVRQLCPRNGTVDENFLAHGSSLSNANFRRRGRVRGYAIRHRGNGRKPGGRPGMNIPRASAQRFAAVPLCYRYEVEHVEVAPFLAGEGRRGWRSVCKADVELINKICRI